MKKIVLLLVLIGFGLNAPIQGQCSLKGRLNYITDSITTVDIGYNVVVAMRDDGYLFFDKSAGCYLGSLVFKRDQNDYDVYFPGMFGEEEWWRIADQKRLNVQRALDVIRNTIPDGQICIDNIIKFYLALL